METTEGIIEEIISQLQDIHYDGDISDIGNEIGIAIGKYITEDELKDFIMGLKHGVSLSNGTHP
jgi:hypothetical protein